MIMVMMRGRKNVRQKEEEREGEDVEKEEEGEEGEETQEREQNGGAAKMPFTPAYLSDVYDLTNEYMSASAA